MEKLGIDNLEAVGGFVCDLATDVMASLADGKVTLSDAPRFVDNLFGVPKMLKAVPSVDDEFLDLDPEEELQFEAFIAARLNLEGASKDIVKGVVKVIMRSSSMTKAIMELVEAIKAHA
jgi:hypothetical protein